MKKLYIVVNNKVADKGKLARACATIGAHNPKETLSLPTIVVKGGDSFDKLLSIDWQHSLLTEPYFLIIFEGIFKYLVLDWFEYVTIPNSKTFEDPLTLVITWESIPPVQDSAIDRVIFLWINKFIICLTVLSITYKKRASIIKIIIE